MPFVYFEYIDLFLTSLSVVFIINLPGYFVAADQSNGRLSDSVYTRMCKGGTTPEFESTADGCILPGDISKIKPLLTSLTDVDNLMIYSSIGSYNKLPYFKLLLLSGECIL